MASIPGDKGFFGSNGSINSDALRSSGYDQWKAERAANANKTNAGSDMIGKIAADTSAKITDAAVVAISSRLNVGETGFDSGVSQMVNSAVSSALKNMGTWGQTAIGESYGAVKGGSYQNKLIADSDAALARAKEAEEQEEPQPADDTGPNESEESESIPSEEEPETVKSKDKEDKEKGKGSGKVKNKDEG